MSQSKTEECLNHPKFKQLIRARQKFCLLFGSIIVLGYCIYLFGIAFAPKLLGQPIVTGGSITYGIFIAMMVITIGIVSSGIYMWWASQKFDVLLKELLKDLGHE